MNDHPSGHYPGDTGNGGPGPRRMEAVVSTFGAVVKPLQEFFRLEAASGIVLFAAAVAAFTWANSPTHRSYHDFFAAPLAVRAGRLSVQFSLHGLINEGLMTVFFFLVGMEIKRELVAGELRTFRRAALPAIAAVGGMAVPSLIYIAFNWGGPGQRGWGIPMATDIAFAIGCLTVLGKRVPHALIVFVTALAIFDDIGGILVIALFYGAGLNVSWLLVAALVTGLLLALNRQYVRSGLAYAAVGGVLWYALHRGGIHATISGVVLGLMIPSRPRNRARLVLQDLNDHTARLLDSPVDEELDAASILHIEEKLEELESPLARFTHGLHPFVAFVVMPLFALANSGVHLRNMSVGDLTGPVALGAALGLLLGKPVGIAVATGIAVKLGVAPIPGDAGWLRLVGVSAVAGIGFTVALFIAGLAFANDPTLLDQGKIGILGGSLLAGLAGAALLFAAGPVRTESK